MKINSSIVNMDTSRKYVNYAQREEFSITMTSEEAAKLDLSDESKSYVEQLRDFEKNKEDAKKQQQTLNMMNSFNAIMSRNKRVEMNIDTECKGNDKIQLEVLKRILESLNRYLGKGKGKKIDNDCSKKPAQSFNNIMQSTFGASSNMSFSANMSISLQSQGNVSTAGVTTWVKTTAVSSFVTELENTTFQAQGIVRTADGRDISFGVDLEMSRAFCARYDSLSEESVIFTDPLIINYEGTLSSVSDQKFLFDLNSDGKEEEISFAGNGGGFLALDKNGDGKINDGRELFGTESGNGFRDLAVYDEDNNGWIDENDIIFDDLKIWSKDSEGKDRLVSIREEGVGAIYLGYVDTEFTHNNMETNGVNGVVRGTGVFLKENGEVGTVQHVDLAI